jgi:hypothetical protein
MPVIPTFRKLKQENPKFKASMGYIEKPPSQKTKP